VTRRPIETLLRVAAFVAALVLGAQAMPAVSPAASGPDMLMLAIAYAALLLFAILGAPRCLRPYR
jgi:hypothetical protein